MREEKKQREREERKEKKEPVGMGIIGHSLIDLPLC